MAVAHSHSFGCDLLEGLVIVAAQQQHVPHVTGPGQKLVELVHQLARVDDCGVVFTHEHVDSMLTVKLSVGGGVIDLEKTSMHQRAATSPRAGRASPWGR